MLKHMIHSNISPGYPSAIPPRRLPQGDATDYPPPSASNNRLNASVQSSYQGGRHALSSASNLNCRTALPPLHTSLGGQHVPKAVNGGLHLSPPRLPEPPASVSPVLTTESQRHPDLGVREMLTSLGLLCLISLLLALLSLIFLLKISPVTASDVQDLLRPDQFSTVLSPDEYVIVYEVTLALCALSLSLNLCCLLVCAVQFLFAVKLVRDSPDGERTNKYLKKSAITRVCAVGGFFVSIPVFLTGLILYTFIQFHSTPAIVTSGLIGFGIVFCGCAMVHNVFVWQKEKTDAVRTLAKKQRELQQQLQLQQQQQHHLQNLQHQQLHHLQLSQNHVHQQSMNSTSNLSHNNINRTSSHSAISSPQLLHTTATSQHSVAREASGSVSPGAMPHATLDLSSVATTPHELSTLV